MLHILPLGLRILSFNVASSLALPNFGNIALPSFHGQLWPIRSATAVKRDVENINFNPDGSPFLWLLQDEYKGKTFYEYVLSFWNYSRRMLTLTEVVGDSSTIPIQQSVFLSTLCDVVLTFFHLSGHVKCVFWMLPFPIS